MKSFVQRIWGLVILLLLTSGVCYADTLWKTELDSILWAMDSVVFPEGEIVVVGYSEESEYTETETVLIYLDKYGTIINQTEVNEFPRNAYRKITIISVGENLLLGRDFPLMINKDGDVLWAADWVEGNEIAALKYNKHIFVAEGTTLYCADTDGTLIWKNDYALEENVRGRICTIEIAENGDLLLAGYRTAKEVGNGSLEEVSHEEAMVGWVICTNEDGEIKWENIFTSSRLSDESYTCIAMDKQGAVYAAGTRNDGEGYSRGILRMFDSKTGKFLEEAALEFEDFVRIGSFALGTDGQIIILGEMVGDGGDYAAIASIIPGSVEYDNIVRVNHIESFPQGQVDKEGMLVLSGRGRDSGTPVVIKFLYE